MKKFLAMLLAAAMVLGLAACGSSSEDIEAAGQDVEGEAKALDDGNVPVKKDSWLCDEKTTLNVLTYDGVNSYYLPPSNDLQFWSWLEDYTNVHINWDIAPYSGYRDVITTRLAGGNTLPDIINFHYSDTRNDAGLNGLAVNLADYWDTCFTNTQKYFDDIDFDYKGAMSDPEGNIYAIACYVPEKENHIMLLYNTEWMKQLGAEIPTTLDEFNALCAKMQAAGDLNNNGEDDEIILTSNSLANIATALAPTFNVKVYNSTDLAYYADENGIVHEEYTSEEIKNYLRYINQLYTNGILDIEINTMNYDALAEKCASDRVGIFACYSTFAVDYGQLTTKGLEDPTGEWYTLGRPLASEYNGNEGYFVRKESYSGYTGISKDCKDVELAAKWLDTLYADPEVIKARCLGWEGETYTTNADGTISLIKEEGKIWAAENFGGGQISLPHIQTSEQITIPYMDEPWYLEQSNYIVENCKFVSRSIPPVTTYTEEEQDYYDMYATDVRSGYGEYRAKFLTGKLDVDADWPEYCKVMDSLGVNELTKMYQSIYDRTR